MSKHISVDDLTTVMMLLDSARTILGEIHENFFDRLTPDADKPRIVAEFPRSRAKSCAVSALLFDIEKDLKKLGADAGYPQKDVID